MEAAPASQYVLVEYPQEGEAVTSTDYTLRIGAPEGSEVEVSIDDGPWQPCRFSVGYWWFDWSGYEPGTHEVRARANRADGGAVDSARTRFTVKF